MPDGEIMCIFFGKAKIRRENKMKKTSKQDTGFVPRQFQIWKCAKPSESVRSAVKSQQQVLNTVCKMYCVCTRVHKNMFLCTLGVQNAVSWVSAVGAHFRGCV